MTSEVRVNCQPLGSGILERGAEMASKQLNSGERMNAVDLINKAGELVGGDRAEQHGDKFKTFARIAAYWTVYLQQRPNPEAPISAIDVGFMMADLKKARTQDGIFNIDDFIDFCGYGACAGEIAGKVTRR